MCCACRISRRKRFGCQNWLQKHQQYMQAWESRERVEPTNGCHCVPERIKMPKRGGKLGFSKNYLQELNPTSQNSPLVPTSVPCDSTNKSFAP
jgi:hypothetical protein